jgi:hypothetical protein
MATKIAQIVKKKYNMYATRVRGKRGDGRPSIVTNVSWDPAIYDRILSVAKRHGVDDTDIIRILTARGLENIIV